MNKYNDRHRQTDINTDNKYNDRHRQTDINTENIWNKTGKKSNKVINKYATNGHTDKHLKDKLHFNKNNVYTLYIVHNFSFFF